METNVRVARLAGNSVAKEVVRAERPYDLKGGHGKRRCEPFFRSRFT
jgi:hypothetical protein